MRIQSLVFVLSLAASALAVGCSSSPTEEESPTQDELNQTQQLVDLPFYFGVPKDALTRITWQQRKDHSFPTAWLPTNETGELGLRVLGAENTPAARTKLGRELPRAGLMKTGDVLLTFRIDNANTIPYVHLTMGISHAGLVNVKRDGVAYGLDQPLDTEHNSPGSSFQSSHYKSILAMHIVRPAVLERDPSRRDKLSGWMERAESMITRGGKPSFNKDYLQPATKPFGFDPSKAGVVSTEFGKGLIRGNASNFAFYCSEMAYHLLTLSNCTEQEINSTPAGQAAQCATDGAPFPMNVAFDQSGTGLAEGPLMGALAAGLDSRDVISKIFAGGGDRPSISEGHRAANAGLIANHLLPDTARGETGGPIQANYEARLNARGPAAVLQPELFRVVVPNYPPVAFLTQAMKEKSYVATVMFLSNEKLQAAAGLARGEIPNTESKP